MKLTGFLFDIPVYSDDSIPPHEVWFVQEDEMIKDSGKRLQLPGMVRDTTEGKMRYDLVFDGPMFERWAKHLTDGAVKYSAKNWMGAHTKEEYERFRESAIRHFIQFLNGDTDEDHAAAVLFNINGMEYVKEKMAGEAINFVQNTLRVFADGPTTGTAAEPVERRDLNKSDRRKVFDNTYNNPARREGMGRRAIERAYWTLPKKTGEI